MECPETIRSLSNSLALIAFPSKPPGAARPPLRRLSCSAKANLFGSLWASSVPKPGHLRPFRHDARDAGPSRSDARLFSEAGRSSLCFEGSCRGSCHGAGARAGPLVFFSSWVSARFRLDLQVVSPHAFWGCFHHGETCRFSLETQFWSFLMSKQITQAGSSKATRSNKATRGNPSVTHPFQNKQSYVFGIHIYIYIL